MRRGWDEGWDVEIFLTTDLRRSYNMLSRGDGREASPPRSGKDLDKKNSCCSWPEQDSYFLRVKLSIATMSSAVETISCNSSYVLIGITSDRLGTGARRPPAPRLSILYVMSKTIPHKIVIEQYKLYKILMKS